MSGGLQQLAHFADLDPRLLSALEARASVRSLIQGERLFRQGDPGEALFVVLSGRIQVLVEQPNSPPHPLAEVLPGEVLGEMALLAQQPRAASAVALDAATVLELPADACRQLMEASAPARDRLKNIALRRLPSLYLASTPFGHARGALAEIDRAATWVRLSAGDVLFSQGDPPDAMYVVTQGSLEVLAQHDATGRRLSFVGRGEFLGEAALLLDQPRSATVRALRDAELIRIPRDAFERALRAEPSLPVELARQVTQRLLQRERATPPARTIRTVTVIPLDGSARVQEFTRHLADELGALLVTHSGLSDLGFLSEPGTNDLADSRLRQWLSDQEELYPHNVYLADFAATAWSKLAVRHADLVLLVADAETTPIVGSLERELLSDDVRAPVELALLGTAAGTSRWFEARARRLVVHHVMGRADVGRVARAIRGASNCLVLGGGGARGLAHVGVIRALKEAGVPIDHVAGTSMGAIIGGLCALGYDYATMLDLLREHYANGGGYDVTLPVVALRSARQTVRTLRSLFADVHIEDLSTPYFCVSADLTRAEVVVHDQGPLWLAVRASCALPGVVPPVVYHGGLLVDGGLLNNVPADLMRQRSNGRVVAVDVSPKVDLTVTSEGLAEVSGWQQLWVRMRNSTGSSPARLPSIVEILNRAILLSSVRDSQAIGQQADLYLHPPVDSVPMGAFTAIDEVVEIGYRYAVERVGVWIHERS